MKTIALSVNSLNNIVVKNNGVIVSLFGGCRYEIFGLTQIIDISGNDVTGELPENFEDPIYGNLPGMSPIEIEFHDDGTYSV